VSNEPGLDNCGCVVLVAGEFGDRLPGTLVVDEGFAGGGGSDECRDGGVVQRARQTEAGLVQARHRVVGNLSRASDYPEPHGGLNCRCECLVGIIRGSREKPKAYRAGGTVLASRRTAGQYGREHAP
jgi:hypothetical protein